MSKKKEDTVEEENWICIRKCYHFAGDPKGKSYKTYEPGMPLAPGAPTNRHFAIDGIAPKDSGSDPIVGSADDPRPTVKIIKDLKEKYGIEMKITSSRKNVYKKWIEKEMEAKAKEDEELAALEAEAAAAAEKKKKKE